MKSKRAFSAAVVLPQKFTDPGPSLLLADVPGMPAEAATYFAMRGANTLGDLRPEIEAAARSDAQCEPVFVVVGGNSYPLPVLVRYKAGEALIGLLGGRAHMLKVMSGWDKPAPKAEDFDENTPPPRSRPSGEPVARRVELPPGEPVALLFERWNVEGRIPAGCVLAEFTRAGYRLVSGRIAGAEVGEVIADEALSGWRVRVAIALKAGRFPEVPRSFAVFVKGDEPCNH